jgi:hypothetical protein
VDDKTGTCPTCGQLIGLDGHRYREGYDNAWAEAHFEIELLRGRIEILEAENKKSPRPKAGT